MVASGLYPNLTFSETKPLAERYRMESGMTLGKKTDEELMELVARNDNQALNVLVERYQSPLFNFLSLYIRDPATAESAAAESFFRVWKYAKKFNPKQKFKTWLFTIARNQGNTLLSSQGRRPTSIEGIFASKDSNAFDPGDLKDPNAEDILKQETRAEKIGEILMMLPTNLREALLLAIQPELTYLDISEILGCSVTAVKMRIHKARIKFKKYMDNK